MAQRGAASLRSCSIVNHIEGKDLQFPTKILWKGFTLLKHKGEQPEKVQLCCWKKTLMARTIVRTFASSSQKARNTHPSSMATRILEPKLIGSMTTRGQIRPTFRVSLTASQAGENSQSNHQPQQCREHTSYPVFQQTSTESTSEEITEEEQHVWTHHCINLSNEFPNSKSIQKHHKLQDKFLIYEFLGLKT